MARNLERVCTCCGIAYNMEVEWGPQEGRELDPAEASLCNRCVYRCEGNCRSHGGGR